MELKEIVNVKGIQMKLIRVKCVKVKILILIIIIKAMSTIKKSKNTNI